jgi:hypothetical protein
MTRAFDLAILNADLSARLVVPGLTFDVDSFRHSVKGGPEQATVTARGDARSRRELVNYLGYPVEILDRETGAPCWWGYLNEATTVDGAIERGASLSDMANKIAVAYVDSGGARQTTAWHEDIAISELRYGIKERLEHMTSANTTQAYALRDQTYDYFRFPIPILRDARGSEERATLGLKGWYQTLDWRYYAATEDVIESTDDWANVVTFAIGGGTSGSDVDTLSRTFTTTESFLADRIYISANSGPWHPNNKDTTVRIRVYNPADPQNPNGTILASHTQAAQFLQWGTAQTEYILDTPYQFAANTTYWLQFHCAAEGWPAYVVVNGNGELNQVGFEFFYKIKGTREHTVLIQDALTYNNQFVVTASVENEAGIQRTAYRDGDETVMAVVDQLLGCGTTNNRRLLGMVMRDRVLRIFEEPTGTALTAPYVLKKDGVLRFQVGGEPVPPWVSPCAAWCAVDGEEPPLSATPNPDLSAFLIDAAEFRMEDGVWTIEPRGVIPPYEFYKARER